ncbi:MAG: YhcN/YlaJ family sporulation lipoprotein [Aristaeellaceae bacterium]
MKKILLTLSALSLTMMLSACTSATDMTTVTQQPTSTAAATQSPNVTTVLPSTNNGVDGMDATDGLNGTDGTNGTGGMNGENGTDGVLPSGTVIPESTGVTSMDKARRVIEQIEEELERLSEVDDAEVVIAGNKAAVGLEFDDQYKTGLDDRMRKIVKERIDGIISGISTVAITADEGVMDAIESLGERLDTMSDMTALQSDLDAIIKKINGKNA